MKVLVIGSGGRDHAIAFRGEHLQPMTLYPSPTCYHSHRTRLVLAEKNISMDVVDVEGADLPEDVRELNPYHSLPTPGGP